MIIVSNPGTHPEMMRIAGGLIDAGNTVKYLTSSSWAADSVIQKFAEWRTVTSSPVGINIKRRRLPLPIQSSHVVGLARGYEFLVQAALRFRFLDVTSAIQRRNDAFQSRAKRHVRAGGEVRAVVGQYTAAAAIFEQCPPGVKRILNYPIAHHRWLMKSMQAEAARNPKWKPLLQGHDFTEAQLHLMDKEVEMADAILVPSRFAAKTFVESGVSAAKLSVVPLGCSPAEPASFTPTTEPVDHRLHLLFAGQVTQRKGIGYLVEAVDQLSDVHLTIVGPSTIEARAIIERHGNVRMEASLPRERLYQLMRKADLLVLPSLAEGFGLVALEAMANGTPCLLSAETFAEDLIEHGENGYVLEEVSTKSISDALTRISADKVLLATVGSKATATANEYSWDRYSRSIAEKILLLCEDSSASQHGK